MPYQPPETPGLETLLQRFGANLRRCRHNLGLSQSRLAERSGVSQSTISRLERGRAPMAAMQKLVLLAEALEAHFPLGFCPHNHPCMWEPLDEHGQRARGHGPRGPIDVYGSLFPSMSDDFAGVDE